MPFARVIRLSRPISGVILLLFVTGHLLTLAAGLDSLEQVKIWGGVMMALWKTDPGNLLLITAASVHTLVGLYTIAMRRSLALSRTDVLQILLALAVPPLLAIHVLMLRLTGPLVYGFTPGYYLILAFYWVYDPSYAWQQLTVLMLVWGHGVIGLYRLLVLKRWWRRVAPVVLTLQVAVPVLAILGLVAAGHEMVDRLAADPGFRSAIERQVNLVLSVRPVIHDIQHWVWGVYGLLVAVSLACLGLRLLKDRLRPVTVQYDGGAVAQARRGLSLLEFSRLNDIPHAHVCGGRGRCGTCAVAVTAHGEALSAPTVHERAVLDRVGVAGPGARLACQALVRGGGVEVERLMPAYVGAEAARAPDIWSMPPPPLPSEQTSGGLS